MPGYGVNGGGRCSNQEASSLHVPSDEETESFDAFMNGPLDWSSNATRRARTQRSAGAYLGPTLAPNTRGGDKWGELMIRVLHGRMGAIFDVGPVA